MAKINKTKKKRIYRKKKELILPLYFGWQIKVVLSKIRKAVVLFYNSFALEKVNDLRKHIIGPFKKYWQYMTVVILLIALVSSSMLLKNYESVEAATYYFVQSDWSGGLDGGVYPDHTDDKTTWNKYSAVDDNLATSTDLSLSITTANSTIDFTTEGNYTQEDASKTDIVGGVAKLYSFSCGGNLVIEHTAGDVAPVTKTVTYGTVTSSLSGASKCWITQNLGASQQAGSATDVTEASAGWYYQFNRKQGYKHDDTTRTPDTAWITSISESSNWIAANDPCTIELGAGWRLPTNTEWINADSGWSNYIDTYNSVLKLHAAGYLGTDGTLGGRGSFGRYWSSIYDGVSTGHHILLYSSDSSVGIYNKAGGLNVRCIKDGDGSFSYPTSQAYYITTIVNSQIDTSVWSEISSIDMTETTPANTTIKYLVSFDNRATWKYWGGSDWTVSSLANLQTNGMSTSTLENLSSANWSATGGFQAGTTATLDFAADLKTTDSSATPELDQIKVNYSTYPSSQTLTSSTYNTESAANVLAGVKWDEDETLPAGTGVTMSARASSTSDLLATTDWTEVASTIAAGFITSGCSKAGQTITCTNAVIPASMKDGADDQWIQYKIELTSTGANTPTVDDINLVYVVNASPDFEADPTASQDSDGLVNISYSVMDEDTTSGACVNCITPSFEYSLNNGDTWTAITSGLSASATTTKTVEQANYTTHNLTWTAKTQIDGQYSTTAKIKVTIDDGDLANSTASSTTTAFTLDTTDPASASIVVAASTTPASLTLSASDSSSLEMKIAKGATSEACTIALSSASYITYDTSSTLTLDTDPATVCVQYKDGYGNTSSAVSATTPETPVNIMIQDTSNMDTTPAEYRLFVAWKVVADPTPGFDRYEIYRSTDNSNYSLIGVENTMSANYYGDSAVSFDTLYYYKVAVKDGNGNISYLSASVNGKANGTQDAGEGGGGSETTAPIISNVATSSIYTTQATITWDTNELSNSTVGYSATAGNFTNEVGVATMMDNTNGVGEHSVILTGLTPNTIYYFKVKSIDPSDNIATSTPNANGYMFTTLPGPIISNVSTSETNNTSAVITWNTDVNSDSTVTYSPNSNLSEPTIITGTPNSVTEHTVNLSGLDQGVKYYYYVKSGVAQDDNGGDYYTFTTTSDTSVPTISSVSAANIADTTAVIKWTTNEAATSKIEYGTVSGSYTVSPSANANYNYNHTVSVSSLTANTKYYYHVISIDANSNSATSTEYNFTTLETLSEESAVVAREATAEAEGVASVDTSSSGGGGMLIIDKTDKVAPRILDIEILDIRSDSATVSWETNESANSFVEYGTSINYGNIYGNYNFLTNHSIKLKYLDPSNKYYYQVASQDTSGNHSISENYAFTTLSLVEEIQQDTEEELTFEEIEALTEKEKEEREEEQQETAEGLFKIAANAVEKAMNIIKQSASKVSISALESTLTLQQYSIEELAMSIPAPLMSGEPRVITTAKTAAIAWRTDKLANSLVAISPENRYNASAENSYQQVVGNPTAKTVEHAVTIHSLEPDSIYHYQLRNKGSVGPMAQSRDFTFRTEKEILEISNYTIQNISNESAIFKWVTNVEANSTIKYIPYRNNILSVDEAKTKNNKAVTTIHEIEIDDFEAGVIYEIEMISKDVSDNNANKKISAFSTAKDDMPPIIRQVQTASALSQGKNTKVQTIISWKTNEPSTTRVYYQKGVANSDQELSEITKLDTNYTKKHVVVITKFDPGTAYSFRAESIDSGGNVSLSKVHVILTPRQKESVFQVILKNMEDIFGWVGKMR